MAGNASSGGGISSSGGAGGGHGSGGSGVLPGAFGGAGVGLASITTATQTASATLTSTPAPTFTPSSTPTPTPTADASGTPELVQAKVVRVIDGNTLEVAIGTQTTRVRLIGMDSPDINKPKVCGVQAAKAEAEELLGPSDGRVLLERDTSDTDRYGRLLRYVWLQGEGEPRLLNLEMVRRGYAKAATYPPDTRHRSEFEHAEGEARAQGLGLWALCAATPTAGVTDQPTPGSTFIPTATDTSVATASTAVTEDTVPAP